LAICTAGNMLTVGNMTEGNILAFAAVGNMYCRKYVRS
jgi:hypothetical protein